MQAPENFDYSSEIFNMILSLGGLIAVVVFISWMLKRVLQKRMQISNNANKIKIIERRALSPKTSIYLIEVMGKTLVIGESAAGLSNLLEIEEKLTIEDLEKNLESVPKESLSFSSILKNKFKMPTLIKENK